MTNLLLFVFLNAIVYHLLSPLSITTKTRVIATVVVSLILMVIIKMTGYMIHGIWTVITVLGPFVLFAVALKYFIDWAGIKRKG